MHEKAEMCKEIQIYEWKMLGGIEERCKEKNNTHIMNYIEIHQTGN